jgi:hypothetical protein
MQNLVYTPLEKIKVAGPVNRIQYISQACMQKRVLDLGCYDETALAKVDNETYLFSEIDKVALDHIGVDNSKLLPDEGLIFSPTSKIVKGDITDFSKIAIDLSGTEIIIAGELIEHLPNTLSFFSYLKKTFPGKKLICSTPNATNLSNILLAHFKRESCHIDHFQVYSYKTLNTLCRTAQFNSWQIIPYHVKYTEAILRSKGLKKIFVQFCEKTINLIESIFPLTAGGYLVEIDI